MDLLIVGVNHTTAPIELREKIAFTPEQLGDALLDLKSDQCLDELAILSTCNRTEIYAIKKDGNSGGIVNWLAKYHDLPPGELGESIYIYSDQLAITHILRVATGLDSMVLGEPQILGQLKEGFASAQTNHVMGKQLNRLSQNTYRIAKQVRTQTAIGQNTVSVASTTVVLASQLFSDLSNCNALLLGAGETIELVGRHLKSAGVKQIVIANRTVSNAESLAKELDATAVPLSEIPDHLVNADILVASTASQLPILGKGTVERAIKSRRHRPIFMVDLAVPRDIEPEVNDLRDIYLYSIDDLQQIVSKNMSSRQAAASEAESLIHHAVHEFQQSDKSLGAVDTLVRFRQKHDDIKNRELTKAIKRLDNGDDPEQVLRNLANQLTNKIIHTPSVQIKQAKLAGEEALLDAIEKLFQLEDKPQQ
ncbi:MAG: glutamyl-tRNA reductase [bacterium]|nr:glutamyl-tRNA reductase [Gammaproteobacteria bacterium]HIL95458.1 glutamyl-tRNA reductase [Pseudomonadales bacterium]